MCKMKKITTIILCAGALFSLSSCGEDYLDRQPTTSVEEGALFSTLTGAQTALEGVHRATYQYYDAHDKFGQKSVDLAIDLMGEDLFQNERGYGWFVSWYQYIDSRNINSSNLAFVWSYYYDIIDNVNIILKNIDNVPVIGNSDIVAQQDIKAQSLTYRAYCHYQLVQLYANRYDWETGVNDHLGVPLMLVATQEGQPRASVAAVYDQINADLDEAIKLFEQSNRKRPNKSWINLSIAQGIKARVALTTGNWATAESMANAARKGYTLTPNYMNGWNQSSDSEWIWGATIIDEQQTSFASFFSQIDPLFDGYATLGNQKLGSDIIINFMSDTDQRKKLFQPQIYFDAEEFDYYFMNKNNTGYKFSGYGSWSNDYLYMKAGEMYLIEAEALSRQGKDTNAQDVIFELVVNRDPDYTKPTLTGSDLLNHILMQRRCDLWGEGFRLLDIKRLNIPMDRHGLGHNDALWNEAGYYPTGSKMFTFLIPKQEMDSNSNMVQNEL